MKNEAINLDENGEGCIGGLEGRKEKGKKHLYYNLKRN